MAKVNKQCATVFLETVFPERVFLERVFPERVFPERVLPETEVYPAQIFTSQSQGLNGQGTMILAEFPGNEGGETVWPCKENVGVHDIRIAI